MKSLVEKFTKYCIIFLDLRAIMKFIEVYLNYILNLITNYSKFRHHHLFITLLAVVL